MRKILVVSAIGLAIAALAACGGTIAQNPNNPAFFETGDVNLGVLPPPGSLPPNEVARALHEQGYTNLDRLTFSRGFYRCRALNTTGQTVNLEIDPLSALARELK